MEIKAQMLIMDQTHLEDQLLISKLNGHKFHYLEWLEDIPLTEMESVMILNNQEIYIRKCLMIKKRRI